MTYLGLKKASTKLQYLKLHEVNALLVMVCIYFSGPLSSILIHHYGNRVTMFIGGIIASLGLFLCAFAEDINGVIITFGVINGEYNTCTVRN